MTRNEFLSQFSEHNIMFQLTNGYTFDFVGTNVDRGKFHDLNDHTYANDNNFLSISRKDISYCVNQFEDIPDTVVYPSELEHYNLNTYPIEIMIRGTTAPVSYLGIIISSWETKNWIYVLRKISTGFWIYHYRKEHIIFTNIGRR
jgi:hypothetical protein